MLFKLAAEMFDIVIATGKTDLLNAVCRAAE